MKSMLIVGRGEAFCNFVQIASQHEINRNLMDGLQIVAFYRESMRNDKIREGFRLVATQGFAPDATELASYEQVYLFPDEWNDSFRVIEFFVSLGTCRVYVMTQLPRYAALYRRLGAHYVFISSSNNQGYRWLLDDENTPL
ncbi:hypothetical protein JNUCC42_20370 [Brevibacterium sp. JNUCC-42]|nr:hypothetical protein [Brevibacillus laterosporus]QOS98780.1 hypothetical protein JNUCC42_20370 [Brevibacterium sp. JNUCC-42]RAP25865.1 hypothetical protein C2W64_02339 [Brevibacillus laterosporus]TPG70621.1 hypothetical protein EEL31_20515 [Brevibacillus laterosporus]TPG80233.1 hypothetical protein EEL32_20965 [Brevibacillus laterosporus]